MSNIFLDILTNLVANIIFWLSSGLVIGFWLTARRKKLNRFFGIKRGESLTVYLSRLVIKPDTVFDHRQTRTRKFSGLAIPFDSFQLIQNISRLFSSSPLEIIPDLLSGLVDTFWITQRSHLEFIASPETNDKMNRC